MTCMNIPVKLIDLYDYTIKLYDLYDYTCKIVWLVWLYKQNCMTCMIIQITLYYLPWITIWLIDIVKHGHIKMAWNNKINKF